MKKKILLGLFIFIFILFISSVQGIDKSGSTKGASDVSAFFGNYTPPIAGADTAQGGNVSSTNLSSDSSTLRWQGYFGTVSSSLKLGNFTDVLYDFGPAPKTTIHTVFATTNTSFNFALLDASNGTDVDTAWGWSDAADNATSILNETNTIPDIAGITTGVSIINLTSYNGSGDLMYDTYQTAVFNDSTVIAGGYGNLAYGTNVTPDQYCFMNASVIDYELIVPVNITVTGNADTQTYYFYLDIY